MIVTIELWANREGGAIEDISIDLTIRDPLKISEYLFENRISFRNRFVMIGDVLRLDGERYMIDKVATLKLGKVA